MRTVDDVDRIPVDQLRTRLGNAEGFRSLALHLSMGMGAVASILKERADAHEVLGEDAEARALRSAHAAAEKKRAGIDADYRRYSEEHDAIARRIEKENPL